MTYPTKDQLENDYFVLNMSQDQIAQKYGYKTRQVIGRLFKNQKVN
jgi:DNA-binding transcriptional regulator LsrR (DeoR family)